MDYRLFFTIFFTVFVAELGDKTQLATFLFACERQADKVMIFAAASLALIVSTGIGVLAGGMLSHVFNPRYLNFLAGSCFIVMGVWTIVRAWS